MFNNDSIDDTLVYDACAEFSGGMFSNGRANLLAPNQAAYLQNMDIAVSGKLTTRRGTKQIGDTQDNSIQGIALYNTPTSEELILSAGGTLKSFNGEAWNPVGDGLQTISANAPAVFVQGVDKLYIAQSDSPLRAYYDHIVHSYSTVAISEVTTATILNATLGSNIDEQYFLLEDEDRTVAVYFTTGIFSGGSLAGDRQIFVNISGTDDAPTLAGRLQSAVDGDIKFSATTVVRSVIITCATAGARSDVTLGPGIQVSSNVGVTATVTTQGRDENQLAPSNASLLCWHTERLVASGVESAPDTIYFSQFLDGSLWDLANWSIRVGGGDGERVTAIYSWTNYNLLVMKEHSIWLVDANPNQAVSDFTIHRIHDSIGCVSPNTLAQVGQDIFFLSDSGVRSVKNIITSEQQKETGPALSFPVEDILNRVNHDALETACAFHWQNRYILAIPVDGASQPNLVLTYNTNTESWSGIWSGWLPTNFAQRTETGIKKMWMSWSDGRICDWMDYVALAYETDIAFEDMGIPVASKVITRALTWNDPASPKTTFAYEAEFSQQ